MSTPAKTPRQAQYGWYSEKQKLVTKKVIVYYNDNDEEIICTMISNSNIESSCNWDDIICLGEVTRYSHSIPFVGGKKYYY